MTSEAAALQKRIRKPKKWNSHQIIREKRLNLQSINTASRTIPFRYPLRKFASPESKSTSQSQMRECDKTENKRPMAMKPVTKSSAFGKTR